MKTRNEFWYRVRVALMLAAVCLLSSACNQAVAQVSPFVGVPVQQDFQIQQQGPQGFQFQQLEQLQSVYATNAYYSSKLKAQLMMEKMTIPGHTFWGARVVGMDSNSPLHQINFQLGDVITRLDGIKIGTGKYWTGSYWWLPQAERHHSRTEVRNIRSGNQHAQNDQVDLGHSCFPPAPNNNVVVP